MAYKQPIGIPQQTAEYELPPEVHQALIETGYSISTRRACLQDEPLLDTTVNQQYSGTPATSHLGTIRFDHSTGNVVFDGCEGIDVRVISLFRDKFPVADSKAGAALFEAMSVSLANNSGRFVNLKPMGD